MYARRTSLACQCHRPVHSVSGRGLLGRWGPNHAGDPVVTRWAKVNADGKDKVLEIILINRKDTGELALPGGMVDPGYIYPLFLK
jgi:hypothetical protein